MQKKRGGLLTFFSGASHSFALLCLPPPATGSDLTALSHRCLPLPCLPHLVQHNIPCVAYHPPPPTAGSSPLRSPFVSKGTVNLSAVHESGYHRIWWPSIPPCRAQPPCVACCLREREEREMEKSLREEQEDYELCCRNTIAISSFSLRARKQGKPNGGFEQEAVLISSESFHHPFQWQWSCPDVSEQACEQVARSQFMVVYCTPWSRRRSVSHHAVHDPTSATNPITRLWPPPCSSSSTTPACATRRTGSSNAGEQHRLHVTEGLFEYTLFQFNPKD